MNCEGETAEADGVKRVSSRSILVICNCRLGDSLVTLPALRALREHYPAAHIILASEESGAGIIGARDILDHEHVINEFVQMPMGSSWLCRLWKRLLFFARMRRRSIELGVVLMPPFPPLTMRLVSRFSLYLKLCGARKIVAPVSIISCRGTSEKYHVVDGLFDILSALGIERDRAWRRRASLLSRHGEDGVAGQQLPVGAKYVAVAPGANMQIKVWSSKNYAQVLQYFAEKQGYVPVYFSGRNELVICEELQKKVPGILCVGKEMDYVICLMKQCSFYLGNDTGLIHLASALDLPCFGIYSCRDVLGLWEPYTDKRMIFRCHGLDCEGCLRKNCDKMPSCIDRITAEEVIAGFERTRNTL